MARVMYISPVYYPTSSASITTRELIEGLAERGNFVDLLVASRCVDGCPDDCSWRCNRTQRIRVHRPSLITYQLVERYLSVRLLTFTLAFLPLVLYAFFLGRRKKIDVVMVMYHPTHLAPFSAFLVSRVIGAPLVIKCHDVVSSEARGGFLDRMFRLFTSRLNMVAMRHAERILALSSELKLMIKKLYGVAEERFVILPNSVDTRMFSCGEASLDVIERLGVRGRKIILYSGSLTPLYRRRGIRFLIKAMPGIVSEESRALLLIVGPVGDGVRRELEDLACSVNVGEFVRFVEAVPYEDMPRYISVADVCVGPLSPSLDTFGSTPRKVVEYLACGKPVIVCRGGVARDLIVDRRTGFLVRYGDVDGLASCVLELFRNQRFARKVGRQGRLHAVTFYDQRVLADRLDREIRDLLLNY